MHLEQRGALSASLPARRAVPLLAGKANKLVAQNTCAHGCVRHECKRGNLTFNGRDITVWGKTWGQLIHLQILKPIS